jgi:thioredoxin reductase
MIKTYDVSIIGSGPAGMFCALKLAQKHKDIKCALIDFGRPPQKRRRQLEGAMGCLPNSNMRFYLNDLNDVSNIAGKRATSYSNKYIMKELLKVSKCSVTKDKLPKASIIKKFESHNFSFHKNDYIQLYPKDIHVLSRQIFPEIENSKNVDFHFDTSVYNISKKNGTFIIETENGTIRSKKILLATGRSGWMWTNNIFKQFNLITNNNVIKLGLRLEVPASNMKDFNKSNCSIIREDIELQKISWNGTVIPEDHYDFASSEFRSNEKRWASKNVSFKLVGNLPANNDGVEQTDRLSKLTFVLTNDRISKEKVSLFLNDKSKVSIINEYHWFKDKLLELKEIIPFVINKGFFHVPTFSSATPIINVNSNLETDVEGLFVAGESAGIEGLLAASVMGNIVANNISK